MTRSITGEGLHVFGTSTVFVAIVAAL